MMSDVKYTDEQLAAIDFIDGNVLVNASAGSGKTEVLGERAYRLIAGNAKLNELLVLTFTNLAAQNMRARIRKKLLANGLTKIAANVDAVNIQTYDAFALELAKKYQHILNYDGEIKTVDKTLITVKVNELIRQKLDDLYIKKDSLIQEVVYYYCLKDDKCIVDFINKIYSYIESSSDEEKTISELRNKYFDENYIHFLLNEKAKQFYDELIASYKDVKTISDPDLFDSIEQYLQDLLYASDYESMYRGVCSLDDNFPRVSKNCDEEDKLKIKKCRDVLTSIKLFVDNTNLQESIDHIISQKDRVLCLVELAIEVYQDIKAYKYKHGTFTFNDIFKFALKIVKDPTINKKLRNRFKYIMVDEYQDTSLLQEEFINALENNNLFLVGDVKQSIYRFRGADSSLFLSRFDAYKKGNGGTLLNLSKNFRTRKEPLESNNDLFEALMSKEYTKLDYKQDHFMHFGNDSYEKANNKMTSYDYHNEILCNPKEDNITSEDEYRLVAHDIIEKINSGFEVASKEGLRKATFSDFAILSRNKSKFAEIQKVFNEFNIPLFANYSEKLSTNPLIMTLKNIIKMIYQFSIGESSNDFPHQYMSLLRSFLIRLDDKDIHDIIKNKTYDSHPSYSIIKNIAKKAKTITNYQLTEQIIKDFDIYQKLISVGDISNNIEILNYFLNRSKEMDELGYDLLDYCEYFINLENFEIEEELDKIKPSIDSVSLLSMHASKGLEYKIVYLISNDYQINKANSISLDFSPHYGYCFYNIDFLNSESKFKQFISGDEKMENLLEELRIFYVACTRAQEKNILVFNHSQADIENKKVENFEDIKKYIDFYIYSHQSFKIRAGNIDNIKLDNKESIVNKNIALDEPYEFSNDLYITKKISKDVSEDIDHELLELGNKYHAYLESCDFVTKDTSFIKDKKDRYLIDRFLKNSLFDDVGNAIQLHEYEFYDEENDVTGVIDFMLVYDDHIDLIDFKLSHIDDEAYEKQVKTYKQYMQKLCPDKKINMYILGILSLDKKEVKND